MKTITSIWKFSRPHTIIGSVISIVTLYLIICEGSRTEHLALLFLSLLVGVSCNIFIVGLNQIADLNIDKINKPELPLPSGLLSLQSAKIITGVSLVISLLFALLISRYLFCIILLSSAIGWAYSMPPFHLKKHHIAAALAISIVRGLLINVGGFVIFNYLVNRNFIFPHDMKLLATFIVVFSVVISWFKDLPDIKGDSLYNIKTLAVTYSSRTTFIIGNSLVIIMYVITIAINYFDWRDSLSFARSTLFLAGHLFLLSLFVISSLNIDLGNHQSVRKFYKRFWWFFFSEYLLYMIAYTLTSPAYIKT